MFNLTFGNGSGLCFTGTDAVKPWLCEFASVLKLSHSEMAMHPKVIFCQSGVVNRSGRCIADNILTCWLQSGVPTDGWEPSDRRLITLWSHRDTQDCICELKLGADPQRAIVAMSYAMTVIFDRVVECGGLPIHGGIIQMGDIGIVLAGQSGAGKSTACRRIPAGMEALCDDETMVLSMGFASYAAHPFPTWSDHIFSRSGINARAETWLLLNHIFFLEQAPVDEIMPLTQMEAVAHLKASAWQEYSRYFQFESDITKLRDQKLKVFENALRLARNMPCSKLKISLTGQFWDLIMSSVCNALPVM